MRYIKDILLYLLRLVLKTFELIFSLFRLFRKKRYKRQRIVVDGNDLQKYDEANDQDSDDENFITNRNNKNNKKGVKPVNTTHRGLDKETGGLEVDYKEVNKEIEKDVDVWDDRSKQVIQMGDQAEMDDSDSLKSFIHRVKTGKYRKRSMGQVELGSENLEDVGHAQKVKKARENDDSKGHGRGD